MKITFYSNFLNHHQLPFCENMHSSTKMDFTFVATEPINNERLALGYENMNQKYAFVLTTYDNDENATKAMQLALSSDAIITGSAPEIYTRERLAQQKLTFRYSERIFKQGIWRVLDPRVMRNMLCNHLRYKNMPLYMLCASAYTAGDFAIVGAYKNKCYKWGYFPEVLTYDIDALMKSKENTPVNLLWCARFLKLKHPEKVIEVARRLKAKGINFKLRMIGIGEEQDKTKQMIQRYSLGDCVELLGAMSPEAVRAHMEQANIFLFTSDYNEGWGAVLNEAMNSGCAVVASHAIGSVPFLIQNGYNGLIYKNNSIDDLYDKVETLVKSRDMQVTLGRNAYATLKNEWNAEVAAQRFLLLTQEIQKNGDCNLFKSGPCSKAAPIAQKNMYRYCKMNASNIKR